MKKSILFIVLIFSLVFSPFSIAEDNLVYNLHSNNAYVLDLMVRPIDLQVTNSEVIKAESVTGIFTNDSHLVIKTFKEGISYISYKANEKVYTIKILVDNNANVDLIEIDKIGDKQIK